MDTGFQLLCINTIVRSYGYSGFGFVRHCSPRGLCHFATPPTVSERSCFSTSVPAFGVKALDFGHSDRCVVVSCCCFTSHFLDATHLVFPNLGCLHIHAEFSRSRYAPVISLKPGDFQLYYSSHCIFFDEHTSFFMVGRAFCLTPRQWALRAFCIALMLRKGTSLFRCTAPSIWSLSWCGFWAVSSHSELRPPCRGTDKQSLGAKGMVSCPLRLSDAFSPLPLLAWSPPSKPVSSSEDRTQLGPSSSLPSPSHPSSNVEDTQ